MAELTKPDAYSQTLKLFSELEKLNRMLETHRRERNQTIIAFGKETYDLQSRVITLRIQRASRELQALEREYFAEYQTAKRDLHYSPIRQPPPVRIELENEFLR